MKKLLNIKQKGSSVIFYMPTEDAKKLQEGYDFSLDQLSVGSDIPLSELAKHIDDQAALEARAGIYAETARHTLELKKQEYERWEVSLLQKVRKRVLEQTPKASETLIKATFFNKYTKKISTFKKDIANHDYQYRLLKVMLDAIKRKGELLPTLRLITQGNGDGISNISTQTNKKGKIKNVKR